MGSIVVQSSWNLGIKLKPLRCLKAYGDKLQLIKGYLGKLFFCYCSVVFNLVVKGTTLNGFALYLFD